MTVEKRPAGTIFVGNRNGYNYYVSVATGMIYEVKER